MKQANGFHVPLLFEVYMEQNADNIIVLNKIKLPSLQINMLSKLNDIILTKINIIISPIIRKLNILKSTYQFRILLERYIEYYYVG